MSDDWQLGNDGKYHWLSWWGVGKCGHRDFYQQSKPLSQLDNADICPQNLEEKLEILKELTQQSPNALKGFSTTELVDELCKRQGVVVPHSDLWFGVIDSIIRDASLHAKPFPKIIVVRGDE